MFLATPPFLYNLFNILVDLFNALTQSFNIFSCPFKRNGNIFKRFW